MVERPLWTLLSNHGHVLVCLALDPGRPDAEVAARVGITERAVQLIVRDLVDAGMVVVDKVGRRNRYTPTEEQPFRHPLEAHVRIGASADFVR